MTLRSPLAHTVARRALVAVGLVLDRTSAPATVSGNTDKLAALKGGGNPFDDQAHRKSLSYIAAISILASLIPAPVSAQTTQQRLDKIISDANIAENAMQRVMSEAKRLKADTAPPVVVPPVITFPKVGDVKPVASGLNVPALLGAKSIPPTSAPDVMGAFRFLCAPGQISNDDPIVYPGQPGKAHLHQFFGNDGANANSTYDSLRKSGESTCQNDLNRSAYWMPAMLDGKGNVVRPDFVSIYYKRRPASDSFCTTAAKGCLGIPRGLRFVFGWDQTRPNEPQPENNVRFNFKCVQGSTPTTAAFPDMVEPMKVCKPGQKLNAVISTPECWNGVDLDSKDHRSHLAAMVRDRNSGQLACAVSHPVIIPQFTMGVMYSIEAGDDPTKWELSSDHMLPAAMRRPGSTFHSDYFEAWQDEIRLRWEAGCLDKMLNCSDGDLGDGQNMARGKFYPSTLKASPRLIPVP